MYAQYMNIYITKQNEGRLKQEPSMSGLINQLLDAHYAGGPVQSTAPQLVRSEAPAVQRTEQSTEELPCCQNRQPCKHWSWDGAKSTYTNALSGRVVEVAQ